MRKLLISAVAVGSLFATPTIQDLQKQLQALQAQIQELKKAQEKQAKTVKEVKQSQENTAASLQTVKRTHYEDHINFNVGIRTAIDEIGYETKSGKHFNNNVLTNKITLKGRKKINDKLRVTLELEAYNSFGMNQPVYGDANTANSNWTANETPDDTNLRVKEAFFNYFFGDNDQYMFSAGRRPSVGGYPANLRDAQFPTSPIAHLINMEFDGFSFWIRSSAFGSLGENYGTNIKFCLGRAYTSQDGKYAYMNGDELPNSNMGGFLFVPYNDGQYSVWWEQIYAQNVMGYDKNNNLKALGDYIGTNVIFKADGVGNDGFKSDWLNNFLDDTKTFISFAWTKTLPSNGQEMLGSTSAKTGYSIWIGADMDGFGDEDRWGVNFVHGTKYFRPMTYSEDTLAGSIAAVRGNAYEVYYNKQLIEHLSANFRATYLDYNHAGSNAFFGVNGNPDQDDYISKATDLRAYIKYQY